MVRLVTSPGLCHFGLLFCLSALEKILRKIISINLLSIYLFSAMAISGQAPEPVGSGRSPKEVITLLWMMGTQGELLTQKGWNEASESFFTKPAPPSGNKIIFIRSNGWPLPWGKTIGNTAEIDIGYGDAGQIDSSLRYTPPKPTRAIKTGVFYRLVYVRTHWTQRSFHKNGKMEEKEMIGPMEWQIDGSPEQPWTTVNTAIRYVLEVRDKTNNPVIRRNADRTITELLKWK
jgi:hypothetical protein